MPEPHLRLKRPASELLDAHMRNAELIARMPAKPKLLAKVASTEKLPLEPREISWRPGGGSRAEELDSLRRHQEWLEKVRSAKKVKPS